MTEMNEQIYDYVNISTLLSFFVTTAIAPWWPFKKKFLDVEAMTIFYTVCECSTFFKQICITLQKITRNELELY